MQPAANGSLCGCGSGAGWSGWLRKRRAALVWMAVVGYLLRRETEDLAKYLVILRYLKRKTLN